MNAIVQQFQPVATLNDFQVFDGYETKYATANIVLEQTFPNFFGGCLNKITLNLRFDEHGFDVEETQIQYFNLPVNAHGQADSDDFLTQEQLERVQQMPVVSRLIEQFKEMVGEVA
ncbi:hypothetical protein [Acinetobacter sp. AND/436]|uniref:hypothetical protein n=1 Tax=Acinetobacter sp. AND/436 TaxID=3414736 RepID=UPI003C2D19A4